MARYETDGVDTSKFGGFDRPEPGHYHVEVTNFVEENDKGNSELHIEVLAGKPDGQQGKTHRETFYTSAKAIPRLLQLACALKLTTEEELDRRKAAGQEIEIDWDRAVREGRQFATHLFLKKDSDYLEMGFRFYSLDDKRAKGLPLDMEKVRQMQVRVANGTTTAKAATHAGAATQSAGQAPSAEIEDELGDVF